MEGKKFPPFLLGNYWSEGVAEAPTAIRLMGSATMDVQAPTICARGSRARPTKPVATSVVELTITAVTVTRSGET